jgi:hypothetical protein
MALIVKVVCLVLRSKMKKLLLMLLNICIYASCFSQGVPPPKVYRQSFKKGTYYIRKDITQSKPVGVCIMLPGLTDAVYSPLFQSDLANLLTEQGYVIMIPILSDDNMRLAVTDDDLRNLSLMLSDLILSQKLDANINVILGGFSVGGTTAVRFYERYFQKAIPGVFSITRVYAIDPPLDLRRLNESFKRNGNKEFIDIMKQSFPNTMVLDSQLVSHSPINFNPVLNPLFNKVKFRMYCEPNVQWFVDKHMEVSDMNVTDCSAFYKKLKSNEGSVELILTQHQGFRKPNNEYHPHSWSIVDPIGFLAWIK